MSSHFFGQTSRTFEYSHTIGRAAFLGNGIRSPVGLALGGDGVIYVVNRSFEELELAHPGVRVVMLTLNEDYQGSFGSYGDGDREFRWPTSVALDSQSNAYVADEWLQRISIFDKGGEFLDKWGVGGSRDGELNRPSGLAFDKEDNLYAVDSTNNRVQIFTKDGRFLGKFGSAGSGDGQFNLPWGISIDSRGDVYVADWRNDRIQKFGPDGTFLASLGSSGDLPGQFNRPAHVTVDKDGDIYVADWLNDRVQVFTPDFRYITTFTGDATISKWGHDSLRANPSMTQMLGLVTDMRPLQRLWGPAAVAVDNQGRIIIADCMRHRLQVYQKKLVGVT